MREFKLNIIKNIGMLFLLLMSLLSNGQQDPIYTQYSFNTQTINPAYAGTWENTGFLLLTRNQWSGMNGTPQTFTLSYQTTLRNENVGLGLNVISDKIGREKRISILGDYSYRLQIDDQTNIRLGLKAGVTNYQNNLSEYLQYPGEIDPLSQSDIDMRFMPNFGVGAYLYSKKYFLGLSIPKFITNQFTNNNLANFSTQIEVRNLFLIGGYVLNLSEYVKFKPTFLTRLTSGAPANFELTANFLLNDKVWLGTAYRTSNTLGFIAQWIFDNKMRVGYAFDFSFGDMQQFNNGTHEIMVSFEIATKRQWTTPRMF